MEWNVELLGGGRAGRGGRRKGRGVCGKAYELRTRWVAVIGKACRGRGGSRVAP